MHKLTPTLRFASALANLVPDLDAETDDVLARLHDLWRSAKETARSEVRASGGVCVVCVWWVGGVVVADECF